MAYTIPNSVDASVAGQASPDSRDFDIITAGSGLSGVISGCAVTTSSGMNLSVAAGVVIIAGKEVAVSSGTVTIGAASGSYNRYDLVYVNSSGTKGVQGGTAASNPVFPSIPANSVILAAVYVPISDTTIGSEQIVDKRVTVLRDTDALAYIYF